MTDSRMRAALIGTLVIGILVGLVIGISMGSDEPDKAPSDTPPAVVGPGPTSEENGVPVGYARTREGAVAAATNFALLSANDEVWTPQLFQLAMKTLATEEWREEAIDEATAGYEYVVERFGAEADISGAAIRYELLDFSSEAAVVKLWTVSVISGPEQSSVEEAWGTSLVRLVWANGDWRVDGTDNSSGPAPVNLPSGPPREDARSLMEEMDEYGAFSAS